MLQTSGFTPRTPLGNQRCFGYSESCSRDAIICITDMRVKEQVLEANQRLTDDIDFRDVRDEIALLGAVHEAERDIQQGRVISNDEMRSRIGQWTL